MDLIKNKFRSFADDESGAGTVFAIFMAVMCIGVAGLAIDSSNAWSTKQRLQSATDIAAHAAALEMVWPGDRAEATPAAAAINALLVNMPQSRYGVALDAQDVVIGNWDPSTRQMTNSSVDSEGNPLNHAVQVTSRLDGVVGNLVPTYMLKMIGFMNWEINTRSVFIRDTPGCANDGFIAAGIVNFASNNELTNGFCVHGNQGVDVNSNILFGHGVHISMPNSALASDGGMFQLRGTNHNWVDGMENQVGDRYLTPYLTSLPSISSMLTNLQIPSHADQPSYITDPTVYHITVSPGGGNGNGNNGGGGLQQSDLHANAVNVIDCPNSGLDFPAGFVLQEMVIVADCKVSFKEGVLIEDVVIATSQLGNQSFSASANVQFGRDDDCAEGGGVTLITPGNAHLAAQVDWFGAQIIAHGDVHISANSNGVEGVSVHAGGDIFATSNLSFGLCSGGVDHYREHYMVRMVN